MKIENDCLTQLTPFMNSNVVNMCQIIGLRNDNLGEKFSIDSIFSYQQVYFDIQI